MKRKYSVLVSFLLVFGILNTFNINTSTKIDKEVQNYSDTVILSSWNFWNNFSYIYILNNWTETSNYEWCSGSGTWGDPYRIENMTIDATNIPGFTLAGLKIKNTDEYFTLTNITVFSSKSNYGIALDKAHNGTIYNCILRNNEFGIATSYSDNNSIIDNDIYNNYISGVDILYGSSNNVSLNNIYDNDVKGLVIYNSDSNNFSHNTIRNNVFGVEVEDSTQNFIDNNELIYNNYCWKITATGTNNYFIDNTCTPRPSDTGNDDDDDDDGTDDTALIVAVTIIIVVAGIVGVGVGVLFWKRR